MSSQVVKAVDVGYGNTKYTVLVADGNIQCGVFPSIAPQASNGSDLSSGLMQRRNTIVVDVNGVRYEVGKDAHLAVDATHGRVLDPNYCMTDAYMALLRGALYYMGAPEIDLLVLGLPVNTHKQYQKALEEKAVGRHPVPFRSGEQECVVKNVKVIPQPIGAFYDHSSQSGTYDRMRVQMNLLIDVGYYTLDWVVACGVKMNEARSGAENGGMSAVLQTMAKTISDEMGEPVTNLKLIEDALLTSTNPSFYGKEFDITKHMKGGKKKAEQFVSVLANRVGSSMDITNIILAGGGAEFFREVLQEKFKKHTIVTTEDPVFANVRGFQRAGSSLMEQLVKTRK